MERDALLDKLWSVSVITEEGCWEWRGHVGANGYGVISNRQRGGSTRVHRYVYELFVEPIPSDMVLDHLCRNRVCWNPDHLEVVTQAENMRRAGPYWTRAKGTHCGRGHEFTPQNTYIRLDTGVRQCRACGLERDHVRRPLKPPNTCKKGLHEMTPENIYIDPRGTRRCRECSRVHDRSRPSGSVRQRMAREREYAAAGSSDSALPVVD